MRYEHVPDPTTAVFFKAKIGRMEPEDAWWFDPTRRPRELIGDRALRSHLSVRLRQTRTATRTLSGDDNWMRTGGALQSAGAGRLESSELAILKRDFRRAYHLMRKSRLTSAEVEWLDEWQANNVNPHRRGFQVGKCRHEDLGVVTGGRDIIGSEAYSQYLFWNAWRWS